MNSKGKPQAPQHRIIFCFEALDNDTNEQTRDDDGNLHPFTLIKEFNVSLGADSQQSDLRKFLNSLRSEPLTDATIDKDGFNIDWRKMLKYVLYASVTHKPKKSNPQQFNAIMDSIMKLPKAIPRESLPAIQNEVLFFEFGIEESYENFAKLPEFIQDKIMKSPEFLEARNTGKLPFPTESDEKPQAPSASEDPNDIPF
jgi:hypothetical protein